MKGTANIWRLGKTSATIGGWVWTRAKPCRPRALLFATTRICFHGFSAASVSVNVGPSKVQSLNGERARQKLRHSSWPLSSPLPLYGHDPGTRGTSPRTGRHLERTRIELACAAFRPRTSNGGDNSLHVFGRMSGSARAHWVEVTAVILLSEGDSAGRCMEIWCA